MSKQPILFKHHPRQAWIDEALAASMAAPTLRNEDVRALDQMRQRLVQLTTAIRNLEGSLAQSDPLPPW